LVVFPEISLQGYPPDFANFYPERIRAAFDNAESVPDGPHVRAIAEHAQGLGLYVIYGLNEKGISPGVIYNTAVLTGPDGYVGKYRKVHVGITEQLTWRKGRRLAGVRHRHRTDRHADLLRQDVAGVDP
jgi:predicted amidohydrolase